MDLDLVHRLLIYHLDDSISVPFAVSPELLPDFDSTKCFESTNAQDFRDAYQALLAAEPMPETNPNINSRWGMIFMGNAGNTLISAYMDSFGVRGIIDDKAVAFKYPALLRWLTARLST